MKELRKVSLALLTALAVLSACNNDDPEPENEEELITTVRLTFTPATGGGAPVIATWEDLDGDGGIAPQVSNITLARNTTYNLTLELLDNSRTPAANITQEIREEDEEHQFFFRTTGLTGMNIAYNDRDGDNRPIGLTNTVTVPNAAATGTLTVILRHDLNKAASGVANGDITNAGGDTDVETTPPFQVTVQ